METNFRSNALSIALVLALGGAGGLITSTIVASRAYQTHGEQARKTDQTIVVTGSARKRIHSDLAIWTIHVSGEDQDLKKAYQILKDGLDRVRKFLDERKFESKEVSLGAIETETHYARDLKGNEIRDVSSHTLDRSFVVTTSNVDKISGTAAEVTELIQEGIHVTSWSPKYHYTKLNELKIEMLGEASKNARERADKIAQNAGCRVTEVRNARMGVLQITRSDSTEVSDSGINDTSTIDKDVTAVVTLTLGIETQ